MDKSKDGHFAKIFATKAIVSMKGIVYQALHCFQKKRSLFHPTLRLIVPPHVSSPPSVCHLLKEDYSLL